MNKFDRFCGKYVLYSLPAVFVLVIISLLKPEGSLFTQNPGLPKLLWDGLGFVFIFWVFFLFYLVLRMVFSTPCREELLSKMAGMKERDEREEEISSYAAKFSFLSTLAMLLFFLMLSTLTLEIARTPKKEMIGDKNGHISLGMRFSPYDTETIKVESVNESGAFVVKYNNIPITTSGILLILVLWQVGSYQYMARRKLKS